MIDELSDIKRRRKKVGLTQGELAQRAGVSQSLIAKIESNRIDPTFTKTKKILQTLDELEKKEEIKSGEIMNKKLVWLHPAVSIKEGPRTELFKSYLIGKWKKYNLIVQPSFNPVTEGTDIIKEKLLSPFLQGKIKDFSLTVVGDDGLYKFGKIRKLQYQ